MFVFWHLQERACICHCDRSEKSLVLANEFRHIWIEIDVQVYSVTWLVVFLVGNDIKWQSAPWFKEDQSFKCV